MTLAEYRRCLNMARRYARTTGEAEDLLKDTRLPGQHLDLAWDNTPLREAARAGLLKR